MSTERPLASTSDLLSIDVAAELRKLSGLSLEGPWQVPSLLVRWAVARGARRAEVTLRRRSWRISTDALLAAEHVTLLRTVLDARRADLERHAAFVVLEQSSSRELACLVSCRRGRSERVARRLEGSSNDQLAAGLGDRRSARFAEFRRDPFRSAGRPVSPRASRRLGARRRALCQDRGDRRRRPRAPRFPRDAGHPCPRAAPRGSSEPEPRRGWSHRLAAPPRRHRRPPDARRSTRLGSGSRAGRSGLRSNSRCAQGSRPPSR